MSVDPDAVRKAAPFSPAIGPIAARFCHPMLKFEKYLAHIYGDKKFERQKARGGHVSFGG